MIEKIPIILTGPPGCGKSYWIQKYAEKERKQLFVCACRKDRTLRDGRQKLHIWARRTEPAILWLEGADDLTPEAQAFLRRILETHAKEVQFILECRDACRLQEPIRSRCVIKRLHQPTWIELEHFLVTHFNNLNINQIKEYLKKNEYSYRRAKQCAFLQLEYPEIWNETIIHRKKENEILINLQGDNLLYYIKEAYSPEILINKLLKEPNILKDYGNCNEISGSLWAFLGSALYKLSRTPDNE
jgi:DNA polymerase III delta prime subunit